MKDLEYSFIKEIQRNIITLFLKVDESLLEQEVDLILTEENKLKIILENKDFYQTEILEEILFEHLAYKNTLVIFCNNDGEFISEINTNPLK